MLRLLKNPKEFPSSHVMKNVCVEDIAMAEREAAYERGALNGLKFMKVKDGCPGGEKSCLCICIKSTRTS